MKLLSHLSPDGDELPKPADHRRLSLGLDAWNEALSAAADRREADLARHWSATRVGNALLASICGNSPFLSSVAVKEWPFFTRFVEEGADPLFREIVAGIERTEDPNEDRADMMR